MPAVSVLIKPASGMCNMRCDYCFYRDETSKREQESYGMMTESTLKNVIRKTMLSADTAIHYMFQGGEPTLAGLPFFQKVLEYQRQYNKKGIPVYNAIQTNGLLIDENWCRFFQENHFLVGLSLDGTEPINDALRRTSTGDGTFRKICAAAECMDRFGVDYNILTVVTSKIVGEIQKIYPFYKKKGWMYQQYIACLDPLDEGHQSTRFSLTPPVYGRFLIQLFRMWYQDVKRGQAPYVRQFENYVGIAAGRLPASCDQCGTCSVQYVTEANGNVYPCDFYMLDEYLLGNFNENSRQELDEKRNEIGFIERSEKLSARCRSCAYYKMCKGGCQRNRDYNPQLDSYENYFCESYRMFFSECLDQIQELANTFQLY